MVLKSGLLCAVLLVGLLTLSTSVSSRRLARQKIKPTKLRIVY